MLKLRNFNAGRCQFEPTWRWMMFVCVAANLNWLGGEWLLMACIHFSVLSHRLSARASIQMPMMRWECINNLLWHQKSRLLSLPPNSPTQGHSCNALLSCQTCEVEWKVNHRYKACWCIRRLVQGDLKDTLRGGSPSQLWSQPYYVHKSSRLHH